LGAFPKMAPLGGFRQNAAADVPFGVASPCFKAPDALY